jgi:C-terminal processing protease CtpA/Prc
MRSSPVIALILVAAVGITIGLLLQPPRVAPSATPEGDSQTPDTVSDNDDFARLRSQLEQEIKARQSLEQKVAALSTQLARLTNDKSPSLPSASEGATDEQATTDTDQPDNGQTWFNQQALLDAGMGSAEAEQLKVFFEELEMQRLYLRDRAIREKWANTQRFRNELQQLNTQEAALQNQLSEQAYDAYLYASGQPNRVVVQSVLASAPAASAGIQAGDHVLRYDNKRIYAWRELREATAEGDINEMVAIEVERDGRRIQLFVPRGPLGIRMTTTSMAP